jgi:hypothetical protein
MNGCSDNACNLRDQCPAKARRKRRPGTRPRSFGSPSRVWLGLSQTTSALLAARVGRLQPDMPN